MPYSSKLTAPGKIADIPFLHSRGLGGWMIGSTVSFFASLSNFKLNVTVHQPAATPNRRSKKTKFAARRSAREHARYSANGLPLS